MADEPLTLSVVVTSFNHLPLLRPLVEQLLDQDFDPAGYEVIVVDDGSTDGSREWLSSQSDPRLRWIFGDEDRGRSASRNAGIRAARGRVVVMFDGDHTVSRDCLSIHAADHARERCVIVGKSVFADNPRCRALNHYLNGGGASKLPLHTPLPGRYFLTRNCSVPRDLLLEVGLFDEHFHAWGGEDLDLGVRLEETGVPIYGEPRALAVHHHLRPLNALLANLYVYGHDGVPVLLARHPRLFKELNLHRVLDAPGSLRATGIRRRLLRLFMSAPVYHTLRWGANLLRRWHLPRMLFDYLHLRQYARGYMDHLKHRGG